MGGCNGRSAVVGVNGGNVESVRDNVHRCFVCRGTDHQSILYIARRKHNNSDELHELLIQIFHDKAYHDFLP